MTVSHDHFFVVFWDEILLWRMIRNNFALKKYILLKLFFFFLFFKKKKFGSACLYEKLIDIQDSILCFFLRTLASCHSFMKSGLMLVDTSRFT